MSKPKNDIPKMALTDFESHVQAEAVKRFGKEALDPDIHELGSLLVLFYQAKKHGRESVMLAAEADIMGIILDALHAGEERYFRSVSDLIPIASKNAPNDQVATLLLSLLKYHPESPQKQPIKDKDPQYKEKTGIAKTLKSDFPIWPPTASELLAWLSTTMGMKNRQGDPLSVSTVSDNAKRLGFPLRPDKAGAPKKAK